MINALPAHEEPPFDPGRLPAGATVVDMTWREGVEAPLVGATRDAGRRIIDGRAVLVEEIRHQVHTMTGRDVDAGPLEAVLGEGNGVAPAD